MSGRLTCSENVNAHVTAHLLRDTWVVGPLVSTALWPVSKIFEYHVTGTLENPKSEPIYVLPKLLLLPLHPIRTLEEISHARRRLGHEPSAGKLRSIQARGGIIGLGTTVAVRRSCVRHLVWRCVGDIDAMSFVPGRLFGFRFCVTLRLDLFQSFLGLNLFKFVLVVLGFGMGDARQTSFFFFGLEGRQFGCLQNRRAHQHQQFVAGFVAGSSH